MFEGSIFHRVEQGYLSFNVLDKPEEEVEAFLRSSVRGETVEEVRYDLVGGLSLFESILAIFLQQGQQRTRSCDALEREIEEKTVINMKP